MSIQSIPRCGLFSVIYLDLTSDKALIGFNPLLSASAVGIPSNASANALTAYYSTVDISSAYLPTYSAHDSSADPPP